MEVYEIAAFMNIFFDLDGTLLESRPRLYHLFQQLVPLSKLSFDEYWSLKRDKISHQEILSKKFEYSDSEINIFQKKWMRSIEEAEWLNYDRPVKGSGAHLLKLKQLNNLYLVTARQIPERVNFQLKSFGWESLFKKILVSSVESKFNLIKNSLKVDKEDWIVGDTGKDIQTGQQLGIRTAAVLNGFLSRKQLETYNPTVILESVLDLNEKLLIQSRV